MNVLREALDKGEVDALEAMMAAQRSQNEIVGFILYSSFALLAFSYLFEDPRACIEFGPTTARARNTYNGATRQNRPTDRGAYYLRRVLLFF